MCVCTCYVRIQFSAHFELVWSVLRVVYSHLPYCIVFHFGLCKCTTLVGREKWMPSNTTEHLRCDFMSFNYYIYCGTNSNGNSITLFLTWHIDIKVSSLIWCAKNIASNVGRQFIYQIDLWELFVIINFKTLIGKYFFWTMLLKISNSLSKSISFWWRISSLALCWKFLEIYLFLLFYLGNKQG